MSIRRVLLNTWLRQVEKRRVRRAKEPQKLRDLLEFQAKWIFRAPHGARIERTDLGNIDALQVSVGDPKSDRVIFYIHGGGFVFGSPETHVKMLGQLCKRLNARAVLPRYRLAPEHPFPAAPDDVRAAWEGLLATGVKPQDVVIGGDSAGGALAFGLIDQLCAEKAAQPGAVFAFSPLTDLTFSGESFCTNAAREALLPAHRAPEMIEMFLAGHSPKDPRCSPLFGEFRGAPPAWITVGDTEILLDDTRRLVKVLRLDDVDITEVIRHDLPHVWPIMHSVLPEGHETLDQLANWIRHQQNWADES